MEERKTWLARALSSGAAYGMAALLTILAGLVLARFDRMRQVQAEQTRREQVRRELEHLRSSLEKECAQPLLRARGLSAAILAHGNLSRRDFLSLAKVLTQDDPNIHDVSFSRGTVITYQYPEGTVAYKAMVGRSFREFPAKWPAVQQAIQTRKPVVSGPIPTIAGGLGLFVRDPVFLRAKPGKPPVFLGIVSIILDSQAAFAAAGLGDKSLPIRLAVTRIGQDGKGQEVLYGNGSVLAQHPVKISVPVAYEEWQIAAVPRDGWSAQQSMARLAEVALFVFVAALSFGGVVFTTQKERSRRQLAELSTQLQQAQKMESIGRLAGGVAHDFNNLLGIILGQGESLAREIPPNSPWHDRVAEVMDAGQRAAALTAQLLAFSRRQILAPQVLNLNTLLADTHKMLARMIREDIVLRLQLGDGVRNIRADAGQLVQVILNLAVNARDAMPGGGALTLMTNDLGLTADYDDHGTLVPAGYYVVLTVKDTGIGMSAETRAKIFEPFFTTKPPGVGTGLGLATVHGIVSQSGGHIAVESELEVGTTFRVYFPQVQVEEAARTVIPQYRPEHVERGWETLLLVEDAMALRTMIGENLCSLGYNVLTAANGVDALILAREYQKPIHLLMTDVVMPLMGGIELCREMQAVKPGIPVLFMTGYAETTLEEESGVTNMVVIQKPFRMDELARTLRTIFNSHAVSENTPTAGQ